MFPFHPIRRFAGPLFRSAGFRFQSTTTTRKPQNMKQLMKEYGYPALAVYLGLSCIDLPICYVLVHSMGQEKIEVYENKIKQVFGYGVSEEELAKKQEINRIQKQVEASETPDTPNQESKSVVSYLLSQFSWTEFAIALPITAAITPGVVKLLRGWGFRIGTDKLSTTANIAKDLAKTGIKDITASSPKFGVKPGKKKWWWFF
ncbi:NAT2 putative N-terminal acetyltransferase 2 [Candida maltosa Xu316]